MNEPSDRVEESLFEKIKFQISLERIFGVLILFLILIFIAIIGWMWDACASSTNQSIIEMGPLKLERNFPFGDLITAISLFGSAIVISIGWFIGERQKRTQHEKEYADKIRSSAGAVIAALEWREKYNLIFFDEIQPLIEKTDILYEKTNDFDEIDHFILKGLYGIHAKFSHGIVSEQIEEACKDLYGYSPVAKDLFDALNNLEYIDWLAGIVIDSLTDDDIKQLKDLREEIPKYEVAYRLRKTSGLFRYEYRDLMKGVIDPLQTKLIFLIKNKDRLIYQKRIKFWESEEDEKRKAAQIKALEGLESCYQKNWKKSGNSFCEAIEIASNISGFWAGAGLALWKLGLTKEAESVFNDVITLVGRQMRISPEAPSDDYKEKLRKIKALFNNRGE